jgi:hypothetical protein
LSPHWTRVREFSRQFPLFRAFTGISKRDRFGHSCLRRWPTNRLISVAMGDLCRLILLSAVVAVDMYAQSTAVSRSSAGRIAPTRRLRRPPISIADRALRNASASLKQSLSYLLRGTAVSISRSSACIRLRTGCRTKVSGVADGGRPGRAGRRVTLSSLMSKGSPFGERGARHVAGMRESYW